MAQPPGIPVVSFRIDEKTQAKLDAYISRKGGTKTDAVRLALESLLDEGNDSSLGISLAVFEQIRELESLLRALIFLVCTTDIRDQVKDEKTEEARRAKAMEVLVMRVKDGLKVGESDIRAIIEREKNAK